MVNIVVSIAGQTTTHTVTQAEQDDIAAFTLGRMNWDYTAEPNGPTNAQIAKFGTQLMVKEFLKLEKQKRQNAASDEAVKAVNAIVPTES